MRIANRNDAWKKFVSYEIAGNGKYSEGYKIYREMIKTEEGLDFIIALWKEWVHTQFRLEYISTSQHEQWVVGIALPLQRLVNVRKKQGQPTGKPPGNPQFGKDWKHRFRTKEERAKEQGDDSAERP